MFGLEGGDVGDGGEDVRAVDYGSLDAVTLVDTPVSSLFVQYELQQYASMLTGVTPTLLIAPRNPQISTP